MFFHLDAPTASAQVGRSDAASGDRRPGATASPETPIHHTNSFASIMTEPIEWNERYRDGGLPWDTGQPSSELQHVVSRHAFRPRRALDIGCGTGTNSVWLAQQGFEVTGVDVAPLAVEQANKRAQAAEVTAHFVVGSVLQLSDLNGPFEFFFDRGCYHAIRSDAPHKCAPSRRPPTCPRCPRLGYQVHMAKPLEAQELAAMMSNLVGRGVYSADRKRRGPSC
jgi:SAM-dependent methyltransferase